MNHHAVYSLERNQRVVMLKEEKEKVENPLVSMVDYIRVTFKTHDVDHIIENILHLNKDFMTEKPNGFYGYVGTFELDFIKVFYSSPGDNRGILVELSGQGCRQFESFLDWRKKTWFDFFRDCIQRCIQSRKKSNHVFFRQSKNDSNCRQP